MYARIFKAKPDPEQRAGQVNFPHPLFHLGVEEMGRCGLGPKWQGFRLDRVAADAVALAGVRAAVTPVDENLLHTQARQIVLHRNAPGSTVCLQNHNTLEGDYC